MKIFLKGQRCNRTPLSYPEYRVLFEQRLEYSSRPEEADLLVYSCFMDVRNDAEEIERIFALRPDIRLVILSEEPLWDSLWSEGCFSKEGSVRLGEREYPYTFLNHWTTRIYDFEKIPYFLTTSDDFFARYAFLFARNRALDAGEIESLWDKAPIRAAFYAEFNDKAECDAYYPEHDVWGLCRYRTLVAQGLEGDKVVRVGRRWGKTTVRQLLPDWHLDKLAALDRRSFIVSGLENTHQWNYVSEKIFDAFATLAVPLYFAGPYHGVFRFAAPESFLNLYGLPADKAVEKVSCVSPGKDFLDAYRQTLSALAETFSTPLALGEERMRVVSEVIAELDGL